MASLVPCEARLSAEIEKEEHGWGVFKGKRKVTIVIVRGRDLIAE